MRAAATLFAAVLVVALSVPNCAGRPWDRRRSPAYETTTTAATTASYAEYDSDQSGDEPSASASEHSLDYEQEPVERAYGEPERAYGEPERQYGEPERAYGEPERAYGEPEREYGEPERAYAEPEQNYEVDEAASVLSNGRVHGVQQQQKVSTAATTTSTSSTDASRKSGYVLDGKHYRKYRVEEETPDGFIVGEYGVVSHHDGTTRGVRYTADSSINPRVIYEALAKFLALRRRR